MLKDWLFCSHQPSLYDNKAEQTKQDDLKALGKMIVLAATLITQQNLQ